jgi:acetate kinase
MFNWPSLIFRFYYHEAVNRPSLLTLNSGSSSIKFSVYSFDEKEDLLVTGQMNGSKFRASDPSGHVLLDEPLDISDRDAAAERLLAWLRSGGYLDDLRGIGYRIVHGGPEYTEPVLIGPKVLDYLRKIIPLAPDHLPDQIATVERITKLAPTVPAVACFDTSFHRTMPRYAQVFGLPKNVIADGVIRYGFHGLSYTFIVGELHRAGELPERLIVAHLGNGASMAAILNGSSIDTSMGLTPTGGFIMSNRSGDLDPGVILMMLRDKKMTANQIADVVNQGGGLKGLSGISGDMQTLEKESPKTVYVFCYQVKKFLGAYMAALGGLDTLVFTGGIGENSSTVREWICQGLERLGIQLDQARNAAGDAVISAKSSAVTVRVMKTNEEIVIARATWKLLTASPELHP